MITRKHLYKNTTFTTYLKTMTLIALRKIIGLRVKYFFSQTGEDIILEMLLGEVPDEEIYYVDVGCNDPVKGSNTFLFYLNGGTGICIDGNNELIKKYKKTRPKDIALCHLVSDEREEVTFHISQNNSVSSADKKLVESRADKWPIQQEVTMQTTSLDDILREHLPANQEIHLLSIDVEGFDFKVLKSIDLNRYQPKVIVIELPDFDLKAQTIDSHEVITHLAQHGYELKHFAMWSAYFVHCP